MRQFQELLGMSVSERHYTQFLMVHWPAYVEWAGALGVEEENFAISEKAKARAKQRGEAVKGCT
eukprot:7238460-Lingulodinium_polyedra.AAC.1